MCRKETELFVVTGLEKKHCILHHSSTVPEDSASYYGFAVYHSDYENEL